MEPQSQVVQRHSNLQDRILEIEEKAPKTSIRRLCLLDFEEKKKICFSRKQREDGFAEEGVVALPSGVADWFYNNGDSPLVLVQLLDTSNAANQLDQDFRKFFLAGSHNKNYKTKEAQTREAIMKAKVEEASRKDIATSLVASMSDYSQKLSTSTPD